MTPQPREQHQPGQQHRAEICLDCRTALGAEERCDGGPRHRVAQHQTAAGRERWLAEVWGSPGFRRRARQLAKAGGGGAVVGGTIESCASGCDPCVLLEGAAEPGALLVVAAAIALGVGLVYLVSKIVEFVRRRRNAPRPNGALRRPRRPPGPRHRGTVALADGAALITSPDGHPVAAFGLELRSRRFMRSDVMLRDGAAAALTVTLDDGRTLAIPAGRARLDLSSGAHEPAVETLRRYVGRLDPLRETAAPDDFDPLPFNGARVRHLMPGDRVEVVGPVEPFVDPEGPKAGYRQGAAALLRPVGVPWLRPG